MDRPSESGDAVVRRDVFDGRSGGAQSLLQRHGTTVPQHADVVAAIVRLFSEGAPLAITRSIRAVVINPVQLITLRTRTHIGQKSREIVPPFRGHRDTSTAPTWIAAILGIVATPDCGFPFLMFTGARFAVRACALASLFIPVTAATDNPAGPEHLTHDGRCVPAIAIANPFARGVVDFGSFAYDQ